MKNFAVAILNWNGKKLLEQFLPLVVSHSEAMAEIYVIDNASIDESVAWIEKKFSQVKIIRHKSNLGYAGGYNQGIPQIPEKYVVLLNSDIETTPNWLEPIENLFKSIPNLAACQPKIRSFKDKSLFEYAGAAGGYIDWLGYPFCRGRIFYELEEDKGQYDDNRPVFWATGAALVVSREHFLLAGGLDESLFAHMEEIDLCWRMHAAGFQVYYCGESTVYHVGGATLKMQTPRKTYLNFRNNLVILAKNLPPFEGTVKLLMRLILDGIAGIKFLFNGQADHTLQVINAHLSFYRRLPGIIRKRKKTDKKQKLKSYPGTFRDTLIVHYFIRKNRKFTELPQHLFTRVQ